MRMPSIQPKLTIFRYLDDVASRFWALSLAFGIHEDSIVIPKKDEVLS